MVLGVYFVCPRRFRNGVLLAASLVFYAWGEPEFVWFMLLSIAQGYGFGLLAERWKNDPKRKNLPLAASLCISLGLLGWCKYAGFFAQNLRQLTGWDIPVIRVALPIGISFYTFQIISYVVDVWRGTVPAQKNLINLAAYIAMFPQLIAGPIVRYADVREQLNTRRTTGQDLAAGLSRFVAGLSKKVLLANTLYALVTQFKAAEQRTVLRGILWRGGCCLRCCCWPKSSGWANGCTGTRPWGIFMCWRQCWQALCCLMPIPLPGRWACWPAWPGWRGCPPPMR